ncbi:hypothetical protein SDC9_132397 [bioreactor metagenome]|uniref:Uncharacterized protein n=1 Tax=bioreactor metagenome TaxID=1076179 RepID=A0A645D7X4_9ZZZZ
MNTQEAVFLSCDCDHHIYMHSNIALSLHYPNSMSYLEKEDQILMVEVHILVFFQYHKHNKCHCIHQLMNYYFFELK